MSKQILNVGIIGCGLVSQTVHIPTLNYMSDHFNITYLCDVSQNALDFCSKKVANHVPRTTVNAEDLCGSTEVDVVFVANADEFHVAHTIAALKHNKHVFIEKPMAMTEAGARTIIEAEKSSRGHVMVGYMRRYASAFEDAVKEIGGLDKILYARVRDIIGPNDTFVEQSATFPRQFSDYKEQDLKEKAALTAEIVKQGLEQECQIKATPEMIQQYRTLGSLGSHDLSVMREALGMPQAVLGASLGLPFWNVLFKYPTFTVSYESGFYNVPLFDAHIEVYALEKSIRVQYDTPFVKGLPITMHIREHIGQGAYQERTIRRTYEDAYTLEMKRLYALVVEGQPVKTTAEDALQDLYIFRMIMQAGSTSGDATAPAR